MKIPRLTLLISVLSFSLFAAGCGGNADADPDSVSVSEPDAPSLTSSTATDAFLWINFRRSQAGLPEFTRNANLDTAAQAHSDYQNINDITSHEEVSGNEGFTGEALPDRLAAAGYAFTPGAFQAEGEVISRTGNTLGENAAEDLLGAIYHRFVMLEPVYKEAGAGAASTDDGTTYLTVDFTANGDGQGVGIGKIAVYPFDGQTRVPASVDSNEEEPDPVPTAGIVGYPISVHADLGATIVVQSFSVRPRGAADDLDVQLLDKATDSNIGWESQAAIIPLSPLNFATTYDVHFIGTVDNTAVDLKWSFST